MKKTLLLCAATLFALTACAKEKQTPLVCSTKPIQPLQIKNKPIDFGKDRIALTKEYIKKHYGKSVNNIEIVPKVIVLHWTASNSFKSSFSFMKSERLGGGRKDIAKASALNVSAHFLINRDGTIYRLMPDNWMARHVIGLNYSSIGVENVGGNDNLTSAQLKSNVELIKYLKAKYPTIEYLIGHLEYKRMEHTSLWLEKDKNYRTTKTDPGVKFMSKVRSHVKNLNLKMPPKGK